MNLETNVKKPHALKGRPPNNKFPKGNEINLGRWQSPEQKAKRQATLKEHDPNGERYEKAKRTRAANIASGTVVPGPTWNKGKHLTPEWAAKIGKKAKARFQDPKFLKKHYKAMNIKPNKPEAEILLLLEKLYPGEWKYTGDFSFTINGKCPDFVNCNGQKKIIELFGDYWHKGQNPQDRADIFSPFGYDTLVIWERELKDMESVKNKIQEFQEA